MFHFFEAITNRSGDSLIGYFGRVIDPASNNVVTIASDDNGTPISVVSGVVNMAVTDANGNLDFYVAPGTYHLDIYAPNATSLILRVKNVAMNSTKGDMGPQGLKGDQGEGLADVMAPTGAALVGYGVRTLKQALDNLHATPEEFGALGDRVNDDGPAINAALTALAAKGGGKLVLGRGKTYRTTQTVRVPDSCMIEGPVPVQYPFNGALGASYIEADFPEGSKLRWVVENAVTKASGGAALAYDEVAAGSLNTYNPTYNVGFRNFGIRSRTSVIPYGGLRISCAPGAFVDGVGVASVGNGILINYCFDAWIRAHSMGIYIGFAVWNDCNASTLKLYAAQDYSKPKTIPSAYRLGFMPAFDGSLVSARGMASDSHTTRAFGLTMGSTSSQCVNNDMTFVSERYSGAALLLNVQGLEFTRFYTEGDAGDVDIVLAGWSANNVEIAKLHAFTSGGKTFDLGASTSVVIRPGGIINTASFGDGPFAGDGSKLIVKNFSPSPSPLCPTVLRPASILYPDIPGPWKSVTAFSNGWSAASPVSYRFNKGNLQFRGGLTGGTYGTFAFTLDDGFRPAISAGTGGSGGGTLGVQSNGLVVPYPNGATIGIDGISVPLD